MKKTIYVEGMMCDHCVKHVRDALHDVEGVQSVEVNLDTGCAVVLGDGIKNQRIDEAIQEYGYKVKDIQEQ